MIITVEVTEKALYLKSFPLISRKWQCSSWDNLDLHRRPHFFFFSDWCWLLDRHEWAFKSRSSVSFSWAFIVCQFESIHSHHQITTAKLSVQHLTVATTFGSPLLCCLQIHQHRCGTDCANKDCASAASEGNLHLLLLLFTSTSGSHERAEYYLPIYFAQVEENVCLCLLECPSMDFARATRKEGRWNKTNQQKCGQWWSCMCVWSCTRNQSIKMATCFFFLPIHSPSPPQWSIVSGEVRCHQCSTTTTTSRQCSHNYLLNRKEEQEEEEVVKSLPVVIEKARWPHLVTLYPFHFNFVYSCCWASLTRLSLFYCAFYWQFFCSLKSLSFVFSPGLCCTLLSWIMTAAASPFPCRHGRRRLWSLFVIYLTCCWLVIT